MALCKRLIGRLDIKGSRLIKGIRFEGLRVLGDPAESALRYYKAGADELLYLDVVASLYGRNGLADLLRSTSRNVFIPVTAGGGIRSVDDAKSLLSAGADKIAINTAALQRPELITELASSFGKQCVVASIQARRTGSGTWEAMSNAGRERSGEDVLSWIQKVQQLGAGEILLSSIDQDGTCLGPDHELLVAASEIAQVPLVFSGGFASEDQVLQALQLPAVSGVSLGAAVHKNRLNFGDLKQQLVDASATLPIRVPSLSSQIQLVDNSGPLVGKLIGIVDYGMGNQQSLYNAFEHLGADVSLSAEPGFLQKCDLLALPGVGSFPKGMAELQHSGLDCFLRDWVISGHPLLGICLGMQMMFEAGEEFGCTTGLGFFKGHVLPLATHDDTGKKLVKPHMGWNRLIPGEAWHQSFKSVSFNQYFVHSYAATGIDPKYVLFYCRYGHEPFVAAVSHGVVAGFQFHPERSGMDGLELLAAVCGQLLSSKAD
tara:strand:+ start:2582 stop:4042 length:1461 start_codon:yes stop_codon:yes gene_type:complete